MDDDSSHKIEVRVEAEGWHDIMAEPAGWSRRAALAALRAAAPRRVPTEVGILLSTDSAVRELNRTWRGIDRPTNVLSFPLEMAESVRRAARVARLPLGDIVLALETVRREATTEARPVEHHLAHLTVHGTLHLLGLDHASEAEAEAMERLEVAILAGLGVPDPYSTELPA